jgi:hypothetical protein
MLKEKSRVNAWLGAIAPGTEIQARAPFTVVSSCRGSIIRIQVFCAFISGPDLDPRSWFSLQKNLRSFTDVKKYIFFLSRLQYISF